MFAFMCPQAHITRKAHIIAVGSIICPKGKHH